MKNPPVKFGFSFSKSQNSSSGALSQMDTLPGISLIKKTDVLIIPVLVFSLKRSTMGPSAIPFRIQKSMTGDNDCFRTGYL